MKNCACLACGSSNVEIQSEFSPFEYKGETTLIPHNFICCNDCGSETDTDEQSRESKRRVLAFRKKVDGFLSGVEIKAIRMKLGINQSDAAKIFGGGAVAFSKYENDDVSQSEPMNNLLIVARDIPEVFMVLAKKAGIKVRARQTSSPSGGLRHNRRTSRARHGKSDPAKRTSASLWQPVNSWDSKVDMTFHPETESPLVPVTGVADTVAFSYFGG